MALSLDGTTGITSDGGTPVIENLDTTATGIAVTGELTTTGNVGIGTTTMNGKFNIQGASVTNPTTFSSCGYIADGAVDTKAGTIRNAFDTNSSYSTYWTAFRGGGGSTYQARFGVASGSGDVDVMTLTSAGNVGIGVSSPATKLDVNGGFAVSGSVSGFAGGEVRLGTSTANLDNAVSTISTGTPTMFFDHRGTGTGKWVWRSASSERMTLDGAGNVGIGTTTMNGRLNSVPKAGFSAAGTTWDRAALSTSGDWGGGLSMIDGASGYVLNVQDGGGSLVIRQGVVGSGSTERMRIDSTGDLKFNSGYGSVATAYGCRAWVNFNGTGTVAIRNSGNVSSIGDLNTGKYQVNFTTAFPDINYAAVAMIRADSDYGPLVGQPHEYATQSTTSIRLKCGSSSAAQDSSVVSVAVFR